MARIRSVKPEFFTSEQVVECSPTARLLFIGMWCFCDDRGVHPASLARLKMEVFPNDAFTSEQIQVLINELLQRGLIISYLVGAEAFWAIPTWRKHQKIEKPTYRYPAPPVDQIPAKIDEQSTTEPAKTDATHRPVDEKSAKSRRAVGEVSTPDRNGMESNGVEREYKQHTPPAGETGPGSLGPRETWLPGESLAFKRFFEAYPRKSAPAKAWAVWQATVAGLVGQRGQADAEIESWLLERAEVYAGSPAGLPPPPGQDDFRPAPAKWLQDGKYDEPYTEWQKPNAKATRRANESQNPLDVLKDFVAGAQS